MEKHIFLSKILLGTVLETKYSELVIKFTGLELQTTSCHTQEALRLDEIFSNLYSDKLTSCTYIGDINMDLYSDISNIQTGIIDNPEVLNLIPATFYKCLLFHLSAATFSIKDFSINVDDEEILHIVIRKFPLKWYEFLGMKDLENDVLFSAKCYTLLFYKHIKGDGLSPNMLLDVFNWKKLDSRVLCLEKYPDLLKLILKSFRQAVKITLDNFITSSIDSLNDLSNILSCTEKDWNVCPMEEWDTSVELNGTPKNFYSILKKENNTFITHQLINSNQKVNVASLIPACLWTFWTFQNFELLFLGNEDEERYSLQAQTDLFRNMCSQASPFHGYSVYNSCCHVPRFVKNAKFNKINK
jgi:hypothetical protein